MKIKFLLSLLFILILTTNFYGQTQFEPGYFVNVKGERINCLIKNSRWSDSPEKVSYKLSKSGSTETFDYETVREFGVEEEVRFIAVTTEFPNSFRKPSKSDIEPVPIMTKNTVFVKQILQGTASLYEYRGNNQEFYLYQSGDSELIVLNYKKYVTTEDYKVRENNIYKRQLSKELICGGNQDIQKVAYTSKSLISYFREYNKCVNPEGLDESKVIVRKKVKTNFKVYGGIQQYGFTFERNFRTLDFGEKTVPKFGVELEGILPFNNNKWGIFLSIDYSSYYSDITSPSSNFVSYSMKLNRLGTVLGGRHYVFLNNKNSIFFEAGVTFDKDFDSRIDEFIQNQFFENDEFNMLEFNFSGTFGLGYSYNQHLAIKLNYYLDQSLLKLYRSDELSRLALTLSYRL
ncbi:PorT family protein [Muricauda sp. 2012CJ35-5]|uniref:PorT family protein n=1 Tax=Flagellimonas spongiicola TaxID=2942208 RepID=A0ABT0PNK0_9FLAO|nr:PorT family protein [Allomuricauda spongiicola]MCL6272958.1 PorT family protein [Allomuricauda spongiicola]